jgi:hypothetical protein
VSKVGRHESNYNLRSANCGVIRRRRGTPRMQQCKHPSSSMAISKVRTDMYDEYGQYTWYSPIYTAQTCSIPWRSYVHVLRFLTGVILKIQVVEWVAVHGSTSIGARDQGEGGVIPYGGARGLCNERRKRREKSGLLYYKSWQVAGSGRVDLF